MSRRLDYLYWIAALAFAIASAAGAQPTAAPAPTAAIQESLVRSIVETWTREQIEATAPADDDGRTRHEIDARWQGDILLDEPGQVEFEIRRLSSRPFRGPVVLRLELYVDGSLEKAMAVTVDCRYYREVVVATQAFRRENLIEPVGLVVEERDITRLKHGWFSHVDDLLDLRAARPIGAGEVISQRHVEQIPVVHRGDEVTLEARSANMQLLAVGEALQDGGVGERIRVRNVDTRKVVIGEIVDGGTIRVGGI
jgi:flagella basal body P-ring formation protein FlgA